MKALIAVDGIDGSGKSTFAHRLRDALACEGESASIVRIDDFRRRVDWHATTDELHTYYRYYFDLESCEASLKAYLAGASTITLPVFDGVSENITEGRVLDVASTNFLVVEGVFPFRLPAVATGFAIYLDTSTEEARRRIIARDLQKGRSRADIEHRIDFRYAPAQALYHAELRPREQASLVINNEDPQRPVVIRQALDQASPRMVAALRRMTVLHGERA
jgi:uridine kinase